MTNIRLLFFPLALCALLSSFADVLAWDNAHFYRASYPGHEPRLEYPWLGSLDISLAGGSSSCGRNACGTKVPLLDIYGTYNMQALGEGVPNKDPNNILDLTMIMLAQLPSRDGFGHLSACGTFDITEAQFLLTQNLTCGWFFQLHFPLRKLSISTIRFTDLSPDDNACPNKNTPEWQTFLSLFDAIMARYNLNTKSATETGVGDTTLSLGWTVNYEETEWFDFIDATISLGILFPTGKKQNPNKVFSLPLGYNGHPGLPICTSASIGLYDWLTLGFYFDSIIFGKATRCMRIKTSCQQSGLIKLASTSATIQAGSLWHIGSYVKADHFCHGLSGILGASYAQKNGDSISSTCNSTCFNADIACTDPVLQSWKMPTLHLALEYDFTTPESRWGTRIGAFYNRVIGGRRVFNTNMAGVCAGFDIAIIF